jgi:hypothetical protein
MAKINKTTKGTGEVIETHGGAKAVRISKEMELRRSVMACMLWEDGFYEDGVSNAERIKTLVAEVESRKVAKIAIEARQKQNLRHVPLLIAREMARIPKHKEYVHSTLINIIQRPDELTEFLSIYWKDGRQPLSNQVKRGLSSAFTKFSEYQLAKYNRQEGVKLRDVMFLTHPKPLNKEQEKVWKKLVEDKLEVPDTWETNLSAGKDKTETFTRLIEEKKLGGLAMLRNLRNMQGAGVSESVIRKGLKEMNTAKVLPFRFITAAKYAPRFEKELEAAMLKTLAEREKLPGKTVIIVDVSGSMGGGLSSKSELNRMDAAKALAIIIREMCEDVAIYATAGNDSTMVHKTALVPPRNGFALGEKIDEAFKSLGGGGIFLTQVMDYTFKQESTADRVIVITDEQDCDRKLNPAKANAYGKENYLINIATNKNGIGYGKFTHIDGFSEAVVEYISQFETLSNNQ